jgi:sortase A
MDRYKIRSMSRMLLFSKGMLILGGLMILGGLAWGIWARVSAPPPPTITDLGAIVVAVTAPAPAPTAALPPTVAPATATPEPALSPAPLPLAAGSTPALLPDWTVPSDLPAKTPTSLPPTPSPPEPTPSPTPVTGAQVPPTRIVAPAIELDAAVVPTGWEMVERNGTLVSEWIVPAKAAGWHSNSALPGHGGNVVLSGHHNIEGKVFRYVVDLEPGDEITVYADDTPYSYIVAEKYILKETGMPLKVRQRNAQWIMPTEDERLTLVTCWPYEWPGNTHRVIVVARPLDPITALPGAR